MKTLAIYPSLLLALTLAGSSALHAQTSKSGRADTLRRELTVMTEETPELGTRTPRDLSFQVLSPAVQPTRYSYLDTPIPFVLRPALSPLSALGDLQSGWKRPEQRGYVFAAGGLQFGGKAGAGLKLLSTERDHWDVFGRLQLLSAKPVTDLARSHDLRESSWSLGSSYRHRFEASALDIAVHGGQTSYNYYGLTLNAPLVGSTASSLELAPDLRRRANLFEISGRYASEEDFASEWLYDFGAKFGYTQSRHYEAGADTRQQVTELLPELSANLSYRLNSWLRLGAQGDWSVATLTASTPLHYGFPDPRTSSTRMRLSASPYVLLDDVAGDLSWRALAGARLLTGNDHNKTHLVLFPRLEGELRWGGGFYVRALADAHLKRSTLHEGLEALPYLAPEAFTGRYERIYEGKLTLGATLGKALAVEAFLGYEDHSGAAYYRPMPEAIPTTAISSAAYLTPLSFTPEYFNYKAQRLGVEATYRHRGIFSLTARGTFANYQLPSTLKPFPTVTLQLLGELKPIEALTIRAGYDFHGPIQSYNLAGVIERLSPQHHLHADAVYQLTKRLSLTAELRTPLQTSPTAWWGYGEQPLQLFGGLQFTF